MNDSVNGEADVKLTGNPTILVVDDEQLMREVSTIMIQDHGGKVLTAVDGLDAVEVFAEHSSDIDIVFMDFSMPRMNGYEALVQIREIKPSVGVIMVSGLAVTKEVEQLLKNGELEFISKPFREGELIAALCRVQDSQVSS